jgi:hypothetical protein
MKPEAAGHPMIAVTCLFPPLIAKRNKPAARAGDRVWLFLAA